MVRTGRAHFIVEVCKKRNKKTYNPCMNIKQQSSQRQVSYPSDTTARARLAAALGLAASMALMGCDDSPLQQAEGGSIAYDESSSSAAENPEAGGVAYDPSSSSVMASSSSQGVVNIEPEGGVIEYIPPSSSSSEPLSGAVAYVDSSSSVTVASSSSDANLVVEPIEPYVTAGVIAYDPSQDASSADASSSSSAP